MNENLGVSVLRVGYEIDRNSPDWPTVTISIDGVNPFAEVAPEWGGFDPSAVFIEDSPLLPQNPPRRVGVWRCSCGIEGCGVIAPIIAGSENGEWVTWSDPRDYTGVFVGPYPIDANPADGRPWALPTYRFEMSQYVVEVRRAAANRSWESPRRATARLLTELLRGSELPAGLSFPSWAVAMYTDASGRPPGGPAYKEYARHRRLNLSPFDQTVKDVANRARTKG